MTDLIFISSTTCQLNCLIILLSLTIFKKAYNLAAEKAAGLNGSRQDEYLRLSAMVLIWDLKLDEQVISNLSDLTESGNKTVREQAALVKRLEEVYAGIRKIDTQE